MDWKKDGFVNTISDWLWLFWLITDPTTYTADFSYSWIIRAFFQDFVQMDLLSPFSFFAPVRAEQMTPFLTGITLCNSQQRIVPLFNLRRGLIVPEKWKHLCSCVHGHLNHFRWEGWEKRKKILLVNFHATGQIKAVVWVLKHSLCFDYTI